MGGAGAGVLGQHGGGVSQQLFGQGVAFGCEGENGDGELADLGFGGLDGPGDELFWFVEHEGVEDGTAEGAHAALVIEVGDAGAECAETDVAGAGAVADDVTTSTYFGGATIWCAAEAAGAGAAEDEDSGDGLFAWRLRSEGGFEVVGCKAGDAWPDERGDPPEAVCIGLGADPSKADPDGMRGKGKAFGDLAQVPLELAIRHEGHHRRAGGEVSEGGASGVFKAD